MHLTYIKMARKSWLGRLGNTTFVASKLITRAAASVHIATGTSRGADAARLYGLHTQHDPWRAAPLAWRTRIHDNGLLGAL
jgi:hypothetical protein